MASRLILTETRFGRLIAKEKAPNKKKYITRWHCVCDCGKEVIVDTNKLRNGHTTSCGCFHLEKLRCPKIDDKIISGSTWCMIKGSAIARNLEFNITKEFAQKLIEEQQYKCALSGVSLILPRRHLVHRKPQLVYGNASLDRINSELGYIESNIQWIDRDINYMKSNRDNEKFIEICCLIADYVRGRRERQRSIHDQGATSQVS